MHHYVEHRKSLTYERQESSLRIGAVLDFSHDWQLILCHTELLERVSKLVLSRYNM